jgi:hypothetical protein
MRVKKHHKHRNMLMSYCSDMQSTHYKGQGFSDWFALRITKTLRWGADRFFSKDTAIVR